MTDQQSPVNLVKRLQAAAADKTAPAPHAEMSKDLAPNPPAPPKEPARNINEAGARQIVLEKAEADRAVVDKQHLAAVEKMNADKDAEINAMLREQNEIAPEVVGVFISHYPTLQLYVDAKLQGAPTMQHPVRFENGVFKTSEAAIAEALRAHTKNGVMFKEQTNVFNTAVLREANIREEALRTGVQVGATSSSDGSVNQFIAESNELARLKSEALAGHL
jgi:hypothetical protein